MPKLMLHLHVVRTLKLKRDQSSSAILQTSPLPFARKGLSLQYGIQYGHGRLDTDTRIFILAPYIHMTLSVCSL
jgi:hypothetical protein